MLFGFVISMSEASRVSPRKRKLTSPVWNDYDRIKNDDGSCVARCRHCKRQLNGGSRSGTTHLRKHLEACLPFKQLKRVRHRKLTSPVWNDYDREKNEDGTCVARCKHCKKPLNGASKSGTTHLRKHLDACPSYKMLKDSLPDESQLLLEAGDVDKDKDVSSSPDHFKFDPEVSRLDLARMIILHEYPFSLVHHVGFKTFLENLQPYFKIMSRNTVKADCMKIFENEKKKLYQVFEKLPSRVSLTAEFWSSSKELEYIRLTAHYLDDDWKLQRRVLNFSVLEDPLVPESIAKTILEKLYDWNIDRKVFSIVMDNSPTNDEIGQELIKLLAPIGSLFMGGDIFHVHSCAHIVNVLVQDGMEVINEVVHKVRESVKYLKSSPIRQQRFKEVAKQVGASEKSITLDVSSRWNSTLFMIETALDLKEAFSGLAESCGEYVHVPSPEEWETLRTVHSRLKAFYDAMQVFSSAKYPTANICFTEVCCIHLFLKEWSTSSDPLVASMASKMIEKFNRYWGVSNLVLAIAAILDPRLKMKPIEYYFPMIYGSEEAEQKIANIRVGLTNLYNEYVARSALTAICQGLPWNVGSSCSASNECGVSGVSEISPSNTSVDKRRGLEKFLQETSCNQRIKTDLEMYLEEPVYPVQNGLHAENFDVLAWWKFSAPKYPIVGLMAQDILCIPMSTVASDVAFSSGGEVLDQYRSSMHPSTVQGLICAQDWLRNELQESLTGSSDGHLAFSKLTTAIEFEGEADVCLTMSADDEFSPSPRPDS
ncbi:zinc finger BED domain-containing protein RICESLEEPER 1-like isoform X1 [Aristolochia californica]|uniref:zinc finger BED domain-containing protein RICESLEEPER 1-like isoform X1 n=2 Tax=Aristolochia californica TaxID=171875 RepID=UPI0035DF5F9B